MFTHAPIFASTLRPAGIVAMAALCLSSSLAFGQVDPQARRAIESMAEAVKEAKTISYDVNVVGEGAFFGMLPRLEGKVFLKRVESGEQAAPGVQVGAWQMRVEGRSTGAETASQFTVVSDGARYSWVDDQRRQLIYRAHGSVRGQPFDNVTTLQIPHLTDPAGIERQLAMPTIAMVDEATLEGVKCDVVLADPGEQQPKLRYTIARRDGMPRKVDRLLQGGPLNDRQTWTITNVQVNGEIPDTMFKLEAPEGYSTVGAPIVRAPGSGETTTTGNDDGSDKLTTTNIPMTPAPAVDQPRVVGTDVGNIAPDFELQAPGGDKVSLSSMRGSVVLLDFWGTWCLPCKRSSPEIQKVHTDYKDRGVKVYGLAVREAADENPINHMRENNYTYGLLLRADSVARQFGVRLYPTFIVIGKEGEIVHIESSFDPQNTFANIRGAIDRALAAPEGKRAPVRGEDTRSGDEAAGERSDR
jgi:thiol-disulfide isomerase/thioredoxin/outer membrane lipoprotein-sorting protein